jgi:hypothetical protein
LQQSVVNGETENFIISEGREQSDIPIKSSYISVRWWAFNDALYHRPRGEMTTQKALQPTKILRRGSLARYLIFNVLAPEPSKIRRTVFTVSKNHGGIESGLSSM